MKKHNIKGLLCLVFCVALLCQCFALSAFAEEGEVTEMLQWTASIDGNTISDGSRTFELYCSGGTFGSTDIFENSTEIFRYENYVEITDPERGLASCQITSKSKDFPIIWIQLSYETRYYATEEGAKLLDDFFNTKNCIYRLYGENTDPESTYGDYRNFPFGKELMNKMNATVATEEINVRDLVTIPKYTVRYFDSTDTFYMNQGIVFVLPDGYYYVNFANLDNSHFDADGYFSYRLGSVMLAKLEGEVATGISYALENPEELRTREITYEDDIEDVSMPPIVFWFFYAIFIFILPIPGLVVGLILPHIKKLGKPKYWYSLSIIHGLWILLGIILAIVLLI